MSDFAPRLSFVTLAVRDVAVSRRFYVDGLGWPLLDEVEGEVAFVQLAPGLVLSLWSRAGFEAEVGPIAGGEGIAPFTLAHNVATPAAVDAAIEVAVAAGATLLEAGRPREWGGYTGYVADPDGYRWEIAHNPGPVGRWVLPE